MYKQTKDYMTSRDIKAMETREKIYQASLRVLEKKGFQDLKISDICKEAGVSVGSFYHYYTSKDDVIFSHYARFDDFFLEKTDAVRGDSAFSRILCFFELYCDFLLSLSLELNKQWFAPSSKLDIPKERYTYELLSRLIRDGQGSGEVDAAMAAEDIVQELMLFARGVVLDWLYQNGNYDLRQKMSHIMSRVLSLYLPEH